MVSFRTRILIILACLVIACLPTVAVHAQEGEPDMARASGQGAPLVTLVVHDQAGAPVPNAEAFLINDTHGLPLTDAWSFGVEGRITITEDDLGRYADRPATGPARLIVRAPHHAWHVETITLPAPKEIQVSLAPGRPVRLQIDAGDRAIPADLGPLVVVPDTSTATWITCVQQHEQRWERPETAVNPAIPERLNVGTYLVHLPEDVASFHVLVDHPGFLRCYQTDALTPDLSEPDAAVRITLPESAPLAVNVAPDPDAAAEYEACGVSIMHSPSEPGGWSFRVAEHAADAKTLELTIDDLAAGTYGIQAFTGTRETRGDRERDSYFWHRESRRLVGGEPAEMAIMLRTFDEEKMRAALAGEFDLELTVHDSDGTPAAGRPYQLVASFHVFGKELTVQEGEVPADGVIRLGNVGQPEDAGIELRVNGNDLGWLVLNEEEGLEVAQSFNIAPEVGAPAPDITLVRLDNGESFTLSSLQGQVVLIDFWASWCGPCQKPMAHNNEILARRGDSWEGKAVILGASIDNTIDIIRTHVDERDWTNVLQAWCGDGAWNAEPVKKYAVRGVPTAYLIDEEGIVRWSGHPASVDVEQKIDELLKD